MSTNTRWEFEADYLTVCNCDWGCPCNFNARPTQGKCEGWAVWRVKKGQFGDTSLDGVVFAWAGWFPGPIDQGHGVGRLYIDPSASPAQRKAVEAITSGKYGGGQFEIFPRLIEKSYPTKIAKIDFSLSGDKGRVKIGDIAEVKADQAVDVTGSPFPSEISIPNGIEFKKTRMLNAKKWWMRDEELLAVNTNKYCAVSTVKFSERGCLG